MSSTTRKAAKMGATEKSDKNRTSAKNSATPAGQPVQGKNPKKTPIDGEAIGWRVHELLKIKGAKERFQSEIQNWKRARDRQVEAEESWQQERDEYFGSPAATDSRMQEESAGAPFDGWRFEGFVVRKYDENGCRESTSMIFAWCPPHLSVRAEPGVHSPLSFCNCSEYAHPSKNPDRAVSLIEKYVVLAAFHDSCCPGVQKINPFPSEIELGDRSTYDGIAFEAVCGGVKNLHEADMPSVLSFLDDVKADLDLHLRLHAFVARKYRERKEFNASKPDLQYASDVVLTFLMPREVYYRERLERDPTYRTNSPSIEVMIYDSGDGKLSAGRPHFGATDSEIWSMLEDAYPGITSAFFRELIEWMIARQLIYQCDLKGAPIDTSTYDHSKDDDLDYRIGEKGMARLDRKASVSDLNKNVIDAHDSQASTTGGIRNVLAIETSESKRKPRIKRATMEPRIADHLAARPHDTAQETADAVRCSVGLVAESKAWKLNQRRLSEATISGCDPMAVSLNLESVNASGYAHGKQVRESREEAEAIDDEIDERQQELNTLIGEYEKANPSATTQEVARAVGCTSGVVESRNAAIKRLASEQEACSREDSPANGPATDHDTPPKQVRKQV